MTGPGAPIFTARHQRARRPVAHHRRRDGAPHPWIAWRAAPVPVCQASGLHLRQSLQSLGDRPAVFGSVGRRAGGQGDGPRLQPAPSAPTWAAPPGRHDQGAASRGTRRGGPTTSAGGDGLQALISRNRQRLRACQGRCHISHLASRTSAPLPELRACRGAARDSAALAFVQQCAKPHHASRSIARCAARFVDRPGSRLGGRDCEAEVDAMPVIAVGAGQAWMTEAVWAQQGVAWTSAVA